MSIQQTDDRVSNQSFPASEDSIFPNKSTVNVIIYSTIIIALFGVLLGLANSRPSLRDNTVQAPVIQPRMHEEAPNAGAHDQ